MTNLEAQPLRELVADHPVPLYVAGFHVRAGFPSPADDFAVKRIDLNDILITHPQATFLVGVSGDSMRDAGINDKDTLVVNRALKERHGCIVVAVVDGEFTVKCLHQRAGRMRLKAANSTLPRHRAKRRAEHRSVGRGHGLHQAVPNMSLYALVDGDNFYVSCERVFRPSLNNRPVIVLSNNDGCAISRSNEAKALGIKMGTPWHEVRHLEESDGLVALSANFVLYGDISDRMMSLAAGLGPHQEIYSIDESFVDLDGVEGDLTARGHAVRARIRKWIDITCGVGIGNTKTLAKLANHIAKTTGRKPGSYPDRFAGVCDLPALSGCERAPRRA